MKTELTTKQKAKIIGTRLLKLRDDKNLERKEVAQATGLTTSALSNYELGIRVPRDEAKYILAQYYGVDLRETFFCFETTQNV
ncbi:MAG: helix-turn-helix domain-containing protein [Clostridium sp.]|nr:helix-turn-helix domain-containing protein [Clostridium sp.]